MSENSIPLVDGVPAQILINIRDMVCMLQYMDFSADPTEEAFFGFRDSLVQCDMALEYEIKRMEKQL